MSKPKTLKRVFVGAQEWAVNGTPIGHGGQAFVYPATPIGLSLLKRHVLKHFRPEVVAKEKAGLRVGMMRQRFDQEVEALRRLADAGCPNIVEIVDWARDDEAESAPWFVMRRMEGGSLSDAVRNARLQGGVARVLEIARDVATALSFMHAFRPVHVHRDVKLANIFLEDSNGRAVLGDFGIVRIHDETERINTHVHDHVGPAAWRPPELKAGGGDKGSSASDIYLLGGVIYEALTGKALEITMRPGGQYVHETAEYSLSRAVDDPRIAAVNRMLRRMFEEEPRERPSANSVLVRINEILNPLPAPIPAARESELSDDARDAIRGYLTGSPEKRAERIRNELRPICAEVASHFPAGGWVKDEISRMVGVNEADGDWSNHFSAHHPGSGAIAVRILEAFETSHGRPSMHMSYVVLARLNPDEEGVAIVRGGILAEVHWVHKDVPGSDRIRNAMIEAVQAERDRLHRQVIEDLKRAVPQP